jgi:hypothetical protein
MRHLFAMFVSLLIALPALAGQSESEDAVTGILFEANMENVAYSLRGNGFVDISFGIAVPEAEYIRIVERLRAHPDIPGVLAGRGSKNYCAIP